MTSAALVTAPVQDPRQILVNWDDVYVPADNYRRKILADKLTEMEASLKQNGQLDPIGVLPSDPAVTEKPWTLERGFCRHKAWGNIGKKKTPLMATISNKSTKPWERHIRNHASNKYTPPTIFDNAFLATSLVEGTYGVLGGEVAVPLDKEAVCKELGYDKSYLNKLLRLVKDVDLDVMVKAEKNEAPARLVIAISHLKGEPKSGASVEDKLSARADAQMEALDVWIKQYEAMKEIGQKRRTTATAGGEEEGDGEGGEEGEGGKPPKKAKKPLVSFEKKLDKNGFNGRDYLKALNAKLEETKKETERAEIKGQIGALRFMFGDLAKFPGLVSEDFDRIQPPAKEAKETNAG